jgi:glucose-1-phosphate cytidylyltransferase
VEFHRQHGKRATVTAVQPPGRFGAMEIDGNAVHHFLEKPKGGEGWINGGFFVLEPGVLDLISSDETYWEKSPMETLAQQSELQAYRHYGFWQPMDTMRDRTLLESLWVSGKAPWKVWS